MSIIRNCYPIYNPLLLKFLSIALAVAATFPMAHAMVLGDHNSGPFISKRSSGLANFLMDYQKRLAAEKAFLSDPHFDGSVYIPPGISFDAKYDFLDGQVSVKICTRSIQNDLQPFKSIIRKLKKFSRAEHPAKEREVGAFIVEYADGSHRTIQFTSNLIDFVYNDDLEKALYFSKILSNPSNIKSVIHIHNHPFIAKRKSFTGIENPSLFFSIDDIHFFMDYKAKINLLSQRDIPLTAIVLPSCDFCSDLTFVSSF